VVTMGKAFINEYRERLRAWMCIDMHWMFQKVMDIGLLILKEGTRKKFVYTDYAKFNEMMKQFCYADDDTKMMPELRMKATVGRIIGALDDRRAKPNFADPNHIWHPLVDLPFFSNELKIDSKIEKMDARTFRRIRQRLELWRMEVWGDPEAVEPQ